MNVHMKMFLLQTLIKLNISNVVKVNAIKFSNNKTHGAISTIYLKNKVLMHNTTSLPNEYLIWFNDGTGMKLK